MSNAKIHGRWQDHLPPFNTSLALVDPVYTKEHITPLVDELVIKRELPTIMFMYPENLCELESKPHQIVHWVKPVSTKNTTLRYSRFIEAIAMWNVKFYGTLHWSNRTGIFTDILFTNKEHPWKKPEPLIERLIRNHYPGKELVYDPCAGSFTVDKVCRKLGIPSLSIEIEKSGYIETGSMEVE